MVGMCGYTTCLSTNALVSPIIYILYNLYIYINYIYLISLPWPSLHAYGRIDPASHEIAIAKSMGTLQDYRYLNY